MALAGHLNLEVLDIPNIPDDWLDSLRDERAISSLFPKMKHLSTGTSDRGLALLAQYMPDLESLTLDLQGFPPSRYMLASASNFTRLTSLDIEFGLNGFLGARDLVYLARSCPELRGLEIREWDGCPPSEFDINDTIIDEAAQHMGKMCVLVLALDRSDMLTWESVLSFARYAQNLVRLTLSCNFTWKEAMDSAPANAFPKLWSLSLVLDEDNRGGQLAEDGKEEEIFNSIAGQLAAFAPKLSRFTAEGDAADEALTKAVEKICAPRYVPKPDYGFE
jgi:hypothetical protein